MGSQRPLVQGFVVTFVSHSRGVFRLKKRLRSQYSWAFAGFLAVQAGGREIGRRAMGGVPAMKACPMVDFFEQKITKGTKERQATADKPVTDGRRCKRRGFLPGTPAGNSLSGKSSPFIFFNRWLD